MLDLFTPFFEVIWGFQSTLGWLIWISSGGFSKPLERCFQKIGDWMESSVRNEIFSEYTSIDPK